jgi:hypothetical protein
MKLRNFLLASALVSSAAYAHHTPITMQEIDAALAAGATLSVMQLSEVMKLRADGKRLYEAGQIIEADKILARAKQLLKLK